MKKTVRAFVLALAMVLTMVPLTAFAATAPTAADLKTPPVISNLEVHDDGEGCVWLEMTVQTPANVLNAIDYYENHELGYNQAGYIGGIELYYSIDGGEWQVTSLGFSPNYDQGDDRWNGIFETEYLDNLQVKSWVKAKARYTGAAANGDLRYSDWSNEISLNEPVDFTASDWATEYLAAADEMNIIPAELASEDLTKPITRQEFAKVAVKLYESMSGKTAAAYTGKPFSDTTDADVLKAFDLNLIDGYRNDNQPRTDVVKFGPNDLLTREQMCAILARCYKKVNFSGWTLATDGNYDAQFAASYTRKPITLDNGTKINAFTDEKDISGWAMDSVYFLVSIDAINGLGDGTFGPRNLTPEQEARKACNATREQALKVAVCMAQAFAQ